jgi:hypothetical protein
VDAEYRLGTQCQSTVVPAPVLVMAARNFVKS